MLPADPLPATAPPVRFAAMAEKSQQPDAPPRIEKQILVQRFAKIGLNQLHVLGYSVAGEETVCQIPELNVCFDIGRCPYFALTSAYPRLAPP